VDLNEGFDFAWGLAQLMGKELNFCPPSSSGTPWSVVRASFFAARGGLLVSSHLGQRAPERTT
jgi:hypothetical protein